MKKITITQEQANNYKQMLVSLKVINKEFQTPDPIIMTKEEKIREAYGKSFDLLKDNINLDDGYVYVQVIARLKTDGTEYENFGFSIKDVELDFSAHITKAHFKWRPKLLSGIESNNGWKRIVNDSDLPSIHDGRMFMPCEYGKPRTDYAIPSISIRKGFQVGVITHYRPIKEVPNPLY